MVREERSAGFVIFHRTGAAATEVAFLLLHTGKFWDFPKGHLVPGETDIQAALRELAEETGIADVQQVQNFREEVTYFYRHPRRGLTKKTVVYFLGETRSQSVVLSDEHEHFGFFAYEQAQRQLSFATARHLVSHAYEHLASLTS